MAVARGRRRRWPGRLLQGRLPLPLAARRHRWAQLLGTSLRLAYLGSLMRPIRMYAQIRQSPAAVAGFSIELLGAVHTGYNEDLGGEGTDSTSVKVVDYVVVPKSRRRH